MRGVLNINKPAGMSSYDVIRRLRRQLGPLPGRIGHAGTLDPMASGVLLILLGEATKVSRLLQDQPKEYEAEILLGIQTDTDDRTGQVVARKPVPELSRQAWAEVLSKFTGTIQQIPPRYSALRQEGERLYRLARRGIPVTPAPRTVTIYELTLVDWAPPRCRIRCLVGAGTYIRSLGRDIGAALGSCATLTQLVRTRCGRFSLDQAVALAAVGPENIGQLLWPIPQALAGLPRQVVSADCAARLLRGQRVSLAAIDPGPLARGAGLAETADGKFLAITSVTAGTLIARRIIYADA